MPVDVWMKDRKDETYEQFEDRTPKEAALWLAEWEEAEGRSDVGDIVCTQAGYRKRIKEWVIGTEEVITVDPK